MGGAWADGFLQLVAYGARRGYLTKTGGVGRSGHCGGLVDGPWSVRP